MTRRRERAKAQNTMNKQLQAAAPVETPAVRPAASTTEKDEALMQLGKYFFGLSQLTFGGAVLTTVLDFESEKVSILLNGLWSTAALAAFGYTLVKYGTRNKS